MRPLIILLAIIGYIGLSCLVGRRLRRERLRMEARARMIRELGDGTSYG